MAAPIQTTSTGLQYSGNPDFRGYLAAVDPQFLSFVGQGNSGNDYTSFGINPKAEAAYAKQNNGGDTNGVSEAIQQLFDTYSGLVGGGSSGGSSGSGGGGGYSSSSYSNPGAAALYGNLASEYQNEANTLSGEEPILEGNINNAYDTSVSRQNQAFGNENNQNMQQRQQTRGSIDQNANSTYNALMALLGHAGAAGSSAATFGVPQAVGSNTNQSTNQMETTFNENDNTIKESNQNALEDLLSQKNTNLANALSGLKSQEEQDIQQAQGDVANEAYYGGKPGAGLVQGLNQKAGDIQSQLSDIFSKYATPTFTAPAAPSLASYSQPTAATVTTPSPSTPTSAGAFLPYLTQSANQNNNILTGANTTPKGP